VYSDAKGIPVPLAGQSYLRVVFHGTSAVCPKPLHRTYTGPTVLTPYYPELTIDVGHVALGAFPGPWVITKIA
jgi:hypothetical protein